MATPERHFPSPILTTHQPERSHGSLGWRRGLITLGGLAATAVIAFGSGREVQKYHDTGCETAHVTFNPLSWVEAPVANAVISIEKDAGLTTPTCK